MFVDFIKNQSCYVSYQQTYTTNCVFTNCKMREDIFTLIICFILLSNEYIHFSNRLASKILIY